jgi:uncharacterized membrane protein
VIGKESTMHDVLAVMMLVLGFGFLASLIQWFGRV